MEKIAYIGRGKKPKTLAQLLQECRNHLQTHTYDECEECYYSHMCRDAVHREGKERKA